MPESISISKFTAKLLFCLIAAVTLSLIVPFQSLASDAGTGPSKADKALQPEDEDFSSSPFAEYGEFNEEDEETADINFFQHGRYFGVSAGTGIEGITGNRGMLWRGGFPVLDLKLHYWFNFNVALDLGFFTASHSFIKNTDSMVANLFHVGLDIKYYFDTKNLSSTISAANPYVLLGAGSFTKTESSANSTSTAEDSAAGISAGAGLEFAIKQKKLYFLLEGKAHFVNFQDTYTNKYETAGIPDLTGVFYMFTAGLLFTW